MKPPNICAHICATNAFSTNSACCFRVSPDVVASSDSLTISTVMNPDIFAATTVPLCTSHIVPTTQVTVQRSFALDSCFASSSYNMMWPYVSSWVLECAGLAMVDTPYVSRTVLMNKIF